MARHGLSCRVPIIAPAPLCVIHPFIGMRNRCHSSLTSIDSSTPSLLPFAIPIQSQAKQSKRSRSKRSHSKQSRSNGGRLRYIRPINRLYEVRLNCGDVTVPTHLYNFEYGCSLTNCRDNTALYTSTTPPSKDQPQKYIHAYFNLGTLHSLSLPPPPPKHFSAIFVIYSLLPSIATMKNCLYEHPAHPGTHELCPTPAPQKSRKSIPQPHS